MAKNILSPFPLQPGLLGFQILLCYSCLLEDAQDGAVKVLDNVITSS